MSNSRETSAQEPIGIVIARGARTEENPRFRAYVWGPAPEATREDADTKAA